MNDSAANPVDLRQPHAWRDFAPGRWGSAIDVRDFIQRNVTPYQGDESFLTGASARTQAVWEKLQPYFEEERRRGVLDVDAATPSTVIAHAPGWIDRENEVIVGLQTDRPLRRAIFPAGCAVVLGMLCNTLVCLAIWLSLSSCLPAHRAILTVLPIAAFVAAGFEHAVANMYLVGFGLTVKHAAPGAFWTMAQLAPSHFPALTLAGFVHNLAAVTIGNVIGGAVLVAGAYWLLYRRPGSEIL